jgi:serine/threonine protein kinase
VTSPEPPEIFLIARQVPPESELEGLLRSTGFPVRALADGNDILEVIVARSPALIVLDVGAQDEALLEIVPQLLPLLYQRAPAVLAAIDGQDGPLIEKAFEKGVRDVIARPLAGPLVKAQVQRNIRRAAPATRTLGGYTIERVLGRGGMGIVYLAERNGRRYALKVLEVGLTTDVEALARFRREMETLRALQGPGIPRFYEAGRLEDCFFYVMEYVAGETLGSILETRAADADSVRSLIVDLAGALAAMHAAGLVHRDVKPGNVIITPDGHATLIDYGLAKFLDDHSLTKHDEVLGTILYIAPEALLGGEPGPATDAFALGMTALHAGLGVQPLEGSAPHIAKKIARGDVPRARDLLEGFPDELVAAIDGLLEPDPKKRLGVTDARRLLEGEPEKARPPVGKDAAVLVLSWEDGVLGARSVEVRAPRHVVIGRSTECDVALFDQRASRRHCSISFDAGGGHVKDLGSSNGTFLNGAPVRMAALSNGDVLRVADTEIKVALTGAVAEEPARPEPTPRPAENTLPGFELLAKTGERAGGAVYDAHAPNLRETVSVLVVRAPAASPEARERFLRDAATASALVHANIARVLARGESRGSLYLVTERARGETLEKLLARKGKLPVSFALTVVNKLASALELARTCGIRHGAVTPANVLLLEDGTPKLTGFGELALLGARGGPWAAPEEAEGQGDHRSDIYSLGVLLAAMTEMTRAPLVAKLVERSTERDPSRRFQKAAEVVRLSGQLLASAEKRDTVSDA